MEKITSTSISSRAEIAEFGRERNRVPGWRKVASSQWTDQGNPAVAVEREVVLPAGKHGAPES
jgi:hypothetical protein